MKTLSISNDLLTEMKQEGFSCKENINATAFYASKNVRWFTFIPYIINYYVYETFGEHIDLNHVLNLNEMAHVYTNSQNRRYRWFRWVIPITVTIVISENGFSEEAIHKIQNIKQSDQMGDANTIVLVDASKKQIYYLEKVGIVGCVLLRKINKYTVELLEKTIK